MRLRLLSFCLALVILSRLGRTSAARNAFAAATANTGGTIFSYVGPVFIGDYPLKKNQNSNMSTNTIDAFISKASPSLTTSLTPDPDAAANTPNREKREVRSGHYVPVEPTKLPNPALVALSPSLLQTFGIAKSDTTSDERLTRFLSGEQAALKETAAANNGGGVKDAFPSWASPYARK
jgi:hypothetical protein